jgi:hypothetical protein
MSRFAPVCPPQIARSLSQLNCLGTYHLVLAHDIASRPALYEGLYNGLFQDVILDNGVAELGKPVSMEVMRQAMSVVNPTTVVLPDAYLDTDKTITDCQDALINWGVSLPHGTQFMIVPQGKTIDDFARCAEAFADHPAINFWGVPRNLVEFIGSRHAAIEICHVLNPERRIHMLGFSEDIIDDVLCARSRHVYGIDSAVPLRAGSLGIEISLSTKLPPRGDWFENPPEMNSHVTSNLKTVRKWVRRNGANHP